MRLHQCCPKCCLITRNQLTRHHDRQTGRADRADANRQADRHTDRHTDSHKDRHTNSHTDRHTYRPTNNQPVNQADRAGGTDTHNDRADADRQTNRQTDHVPHSLVLAVDTFARSTRMVGSCHGQRSRLYHQTSKAAGMAYALHLCRLGSVSRSLKRLE